MKLRRLLFLISIIIFSQPAFAQHIKVKAQNEPLSSVIKRLNVEVSFDNKALSCYNVSVDKSFRSPEDAIKYLIKGKPLRMTQVSGVYIITVSQEKRVEAPSKVENKNIVGKIPDAQPMELTMSLKEIVITAATPSPTLWVEEDNGSSRFTSSTANSMPGSSDNSVFNVLRIMPGIRASGEPSDELYIWGSSPGESRVTLDGMPLFAVQSYNSNISYINPYMSSEVRYKRSILSAGEGSQTGAEVDVISGSNPQPRPVFKAMIGTMSANVFGSIPLNDKCFVSIAYRHTLQDIFGGSSFDAYRKENRENSTGEHSGSTGSATTENEVSIEPDYDFQDVNLNVSGTLARNTKYKVSLYGAMDYLDYDFEDTLNTRMNQTSYQGGISAKVNKEWQNGTTSEFSSFLSGLQSRQNGLSPVETHKTDSVFSENVSEFQLKFRQKGLANLKNLSFGGELSLYDVGGSYLDDQLVQPSLFAEKQFAYRGLNLELGLRTDIMKSGLNWQPRLMMKYTFLKNFILTTSWGIYDQYLVKDPLRSTDGSYQFHWDLNTALRSYNTVAGLTYNGKNLCLSVETYLKNIRNSVWVVNDQIGKYDFNLKGIDVSAKYSWKRGLLFSSWSLLDDPRQSKGLSNELKAGGIYRIYPFSISANYVYGRGYNPLLLHSNSYNHQGKSESYQSSTMTYSRMDLYAAYEKRFRHFGIRVGSSLINVFDTDNQKYSSSWMPHSRASYFMTRASRFTPMFFLEINY
jgi:hypothetical protein